MRGSSLARQQRLLRLLDQGDGLSVPRAAGQLGCTERTLYRDLAVLQEIGVPVYQEREGKRLRWRLVDGPKHFFVRRFALAGKVVILDEIHSYDLYTGTLIDPRLAVRHSSRVGRGELYTETGGVPPRSSRKGRNSH